MKEISMILPHPKTVFSPFEYIINAIQGHAPGLAGAPPTIRFCDTVEKPQPCSGVNNCPLGADLSKSCDSATKMIEVLN